MANKQEEELSLFELVSAKLSDAQKLITEAQDLLKRDVNNARQKKSTIEEVAKTLNELHFASTIRLNVGGKIYETTLGTLRKDPDSMLCAMFSGRFDLKANERDGTYFIDRDGKLFRYILNYLRDGELLCPKDETVREELLKEAKFYQVQSIIEQLEDKSAGFLGLSLIIKCETHKSALQSWLPPNATCSLLYRASTDGNAPKDFHRCCNNKGPTLVLIKSEEYICGGYTSESWISPPAVFWKVIPDSQSFLFTLVNPGNELIKITPKPDAAIRCRSDLGPSFGNSTHFDLLVWDLDYRSYLDLGHGFTYPENDNENTYLAGDPFEVTELEGHLSEGTKVLYDYLHKEPKMTMILGPFDNDLAKTVAAYAGLPDFGLLQFSYGATDLELTTRRDRYPLFFRTVPTDFVFNEPRLRFIQRFGWKDEIGMIYDASPYYSRISQQLAESLTNNGTKIVANEGFTQDPAVAVKILKDKGAHIIIGTFHHSRAKEVFCQAYLNGMYGQNYVWIVTSTPDVNETSDWWVPQSSDKLTCTRSQMEEALDYHFTFYYKNEINATLVSGKSTDQFFAEYNQRIPDPFRSTYAPFAYEAMWAIAATLERARPIIEDWQIELYNLDYGRRMVSKIFKEEAIQVHFTGPSGVVAFDENGNRKCKVFIRQFRKSIGTQEVGVYDYNPPTLLLKGNSGDNNAPVVLEYVHWPAGKPYQRKASTDSWLYIRFPLFISWSLISGFILVCCVLCLALLLVFRRHRVIYHSGFFLTELLILGCMLNLFSVVLFGLDGALITFQSLQWVCKARSWFLSLGFTLCLGSLLPRVLFAYRVVSWRPPSIKKVPWSWMYMIAFVIIIADVILLITWQIVFNPRAVKVSREVERPRPYEERVQLVEQCISDNEEGALALLFVPKGLSLLIGTLAAWPARRLCIPLCNNTRNCAFCLVIAAVMCIIEIPIIMHVRQYPNPFYGITGFIIMVVSSVLLVVGVVPQLKRAHHCQKKSQIASTDCNDIEMRHENNCSRCECNTCADPKRFRPQLASCSGAYSCAPVSPDWDYMVGGVPNRTKDGETRIVTETVYIDPPGVPTAAVHTQTMQVLYNSAEIQTIIVRTQSASMITDPEPEIEKEEVMMQTEAEEPTPVTDVETQTIRVKLCESHMQTMKASLSHIHIQTDKPEMSHSLVQTDEPPQDIFSEESDTASVTSSIASPKMERKFKKTKYNVQARIDTNLTPKRKEKVAKSSAVATPRLRLTTPIPYNASRSRDPSPARGAGRSREPSPARNANR